MAALTEEDIGRQMQESVEMQVEEFKDVDSPLGFKIPKMPGSTDDMAALIGMGEAKPEVVEAMPDLEDLGRKAGGGAAGAGAGAAAPVAAAEAGGGMFGGGLFGARRQ